MVRQPSCCISDPGILLTLVVVVLVARPCVVALGSAACMSVLGACAEIIERRAFIKRR